MAERPTRRCVIARDLPRSGNFIAAVQALLGPEDCLEIIMDRRQRGSSGVPDLAIDRRQLTQVADALGANGFAIVPTSADDTPPYLQPSEAPIEQAFIEEDENLVEDVSNSRGRRSEAVIRILGALGGLTITSLILLLAGQITGRHLISQLFTPSSSMIPRQLHRQTDETLIAEPLLRPVSETTAATKTTAEHTGNHSPAHSNVASASTDTPSSANSTSPWDDNTRSSGRPETAGRSEATSPALRQLHDTSNDTARQSEQARSVSPVAKAGSNETGAPPKAGADEGMTDGRPRLSVPARLAPNASLPSKQISGAPSAETTTIDSVPTRSEDRLQAELVGEPVPRGWGNSYAVRLSNSAGAPMKVSGVVLVARMADRSVEEVAMGALPEPGMYRGTVPTGRSTPVDLRVRVRATGGQIR